MRAIPRAMPALITPFDRRGDVDLEAHAANVESMWDSGLRGVLIAGSTGEGPYLEAGEREQLVAAARAAAPKAFLLCGVHSETLRSALRGVEEAATGGADAALLVTPTTLVRHRDDLIEAFFADVAAAATIPILLYSVPKVTGVELAEPSIERLAGLETVVGIKDSGGDPMRAGRLAALEPEFTVLTGATAAITLALASGAHGAITASANYAPKLVGDTVEAARRSVRSAEVMQARVTKASASIERFGVAAVKYAANRVGLQAGRTRLPLRPLEPRARSAVRRALTEAGLD